jgi:hypothetical protein
LDWTIEVDVDPLIGLPNLQVWQLGGRWQHPLVGRGLADLAVLDIIFDFCVHVRPQVALLDMFGHFEEVYVSCYLRVVALMDLLVTHNGWYNKGICHPGTLSTKAAA